MKRTNKKIFAIIMIILMLLNYMPIISMAAEYNATLVLESTASKYNIGDEVSVDLKASELTNTGAIKQFAATIEYDKTALELTEIIVSEPEYGNESIVANSRILVTKSSGNGTIDVGDIICTIKFKALKSSETPTVVKVSEVDISCDIEAPYFEDETVNAPEITLPVPRIVEKHNLKITKTDSTNTEIENNSALFKVIDLNGETKYVETESDGSITISNLEMPDREGPFVYSIQEIVAPTGYVLLEEAMELTVEFDENGTVLSATFGTEEANIVEETNTIEISIANEAEVVKPEQEIFNLVLNKVNEQGQSIITDTAEFTLTLPDGTEANHATVAGTGKTQNISILAPESAGKYVYVIKETKAPEGYVTEANNIIVEFVYEEQENKIVLTSANIVSYNNETVIPVVDGETKTLTLDIKNEQEVITYNYSINIDKVKNDTFNTQITEDNAIFEVTAEGETSYVSTNALGKATYEFFKTNKEIAEKNEYTYTVKEIKAPEGYILDETLKTITITLDEDGTITDINVSGTNIQEVSTNSNEINVRIINEEEPEEIVLTPENFALVINKVDEVGNLITTDSAEFELTKPDGQTEEYTTVNGTISGISLTAPEAAGKQVYFLKETKAPEGYTILNDSLVIEMNYSEAEGKIVLDKAIIKDYNNQEVIPTTSNSTKILTLNVKNEKEVVKYDYSITIDKVKNNTFKTQITEDNAIFEIVSDEETSYVSTNTLGKATFNFSKTNKEIEEKNEYTYTIKEIKAPEGYMLDETLKTITITFNEDGTIDDIVVSGTNIEEGAITTNQVNVKVINEEEPEVVVLTPENFTLVINKVDESGNLITTDSAKFELTKPDGETEECTTTNGTISGINLTAPETVRKEVYFLKETKAPEGYAILNDSIVIEMNYSESEGKIVLDKAIIKDYDNQEILPIASENSKTLTIDIKNEREVVKYDYSINIDKVKNDTLKSQITEDNAIFEITSEEGTSYIVTNGTGKATFEFSRTNKEIAEENEYTYTIKEIKAPEGYILDETSKTVIITFEEDGTIADVVVSGTNIEEGTITSNEVNVRIINEEEPEEVVLTPENFTLVINKIDELGNLITTGSAEFELTKPDGETEEYTTANGTISGISLTAPEAARKQVYFLKETKAPEGYTILNNSLVIEMNYSEAEGKIVLDKAIIKDYDNQEVIPTTSNSTKILTLNVKNEKIKTFNIELSGVNRENEAITSGTTVVKVTNTDTQEYFYKEVTIVNGKVQLDMPQVEGVATYEIEQIKAPEGYEVNPNKITVQLEFTENENGILELEDYTVQGVDAQKGNLSDNNTASIIITNDEIKVEPQKQEYSLQINKLDLETNELITESSAVFTVITADAKTNDYPTTNGKVVIEELIPGEAGEEIIYVIKEKVAPDGYKLSEKSVVIKVGFVENEGVISVANTQILLGTDIATAQIDGSTVKVNVINEKENEELYVVSKKDENQVDIYNLFNSYSGNNYSIENPFIDTKVAKYGNNCTVQEFINNLDSNGVLTVWDLEGNQIQNSARVKTSMILKATKGEQEMTFTIVVKGDADRDGRVRTVDLNMLIKHLSKEEEITSPIVLRALDLTGDHGDGIIRTTDLNMMYQVMAQ